jgi:hypothetical protein
VVFVLRQLAFRFHHVIDPLRQVSRRLEIGGERSRPGLMRVHPQQPRAQGLDRADGGVQPVGPVSLPITIQLTSCVCGFVLQS